jgi:hypothetical protein
MPRRIQKPAASDSIGEQGEPQRKSKDLTAIRIDGASIEALKRIIEDAPRDSVYSERSVNWLIGRAVQEFIERNAKPSDTSKPQTPRPFRN